MKNIQRQLYFLITFTCESYENMFPSFGSIQKIQIMNFPAQLEALPQEQTNPVSARDQQLTLMIRSKYELLKSKPAIKFNLIKNYTPVKTEAYNEVMTEFKDLLHFMKEDQTPDLTKFLPLIFAALEGSSAQQDELKVLAKRFGSSVEKIDIDQIKRGKVKNVNYGQDKRKQTNIREVSNKESFESMGEYFDLKQIKNHRKNCSSIRTFLKSLKKFTQSIENAEPNEIFTEGSQYNVAYIEFANEEITFNKLKIPPELMGMQGETMMIEQKDEQGQLNNMTPAKQEITEVLQKEETASGKKNEDSDQKSNSEKVIQEPKITDSKENEQQNKNTKKRRTKEQMLRDQQIKQKERQAKALELKKKQEQRLAKLQQKEKQRLAKEKQKQLEKQMKEKERQAKEREKQAKQKEKEAERIAKEQAKQTERKAKEAAKQAERLAKEKKNNPGQSLAKWFKPAEPYTPIKNQQEQKVEETINSLEDQKKEFIASINSRKMQMSQLRSRFTTQKMKDETCSFEPYYTTVYIHKSRLQFDRFLINQQRFRQYAQPHDEYENGKYDDSSVQYEDFCGDFCDQKMDEMSVEDEQASFNSAIVPDTYISQDEISSLNQSKDQIDIKINQGAEWSFSGCNNYTADRYTMFCCFEEDILPLPVSEPEQSSNELNLNLKCELYKQIHGFYGAKDVLIKKLATIADKIPKSYLDTLIKETTTKRGYQRLVKPEIIDFLCEQRENFALELEQIKKKREQDNMIEMRGKMNEKQRQIERLILQEAGTYYIIDLIHFLKEKGYRMTKRDVLQFINARTGSEWDDVRRRMNKMQLKNTFLTKKEKEAKEKKAEIKENQVNQVNEKQAEPEQLRSEQMDKNDQNKKDDDEMQPEN